MHIKESHLGPEVGFDEVVEGQNRHCRCLRRHWGLWQVVRNGVIEKPLREEVCSWEGFRTTEGAFQRKVPN